MLLATVLFIGVACAQSSQYFVFDGDDRKGFVVQGGAVANSFATFDLGYPPAISTLTNSILLHHRDDEQGQEFSLAGASTGVTFEGARIGGQILDGTTDGKLFNYGVRCCGGNDVLRMDTNWGGSSVLFALPDGGCGITYDTSDDTLYVGLFDGTIRHYSLDGTELAQFSTSITPSSLAYEPSTDTLWFASGTDVRQVSKTGTELQTITLSQSLGNNFGGEFLLQASASANGDPHLRGANGVKYDLKGVAGGVYSLFISPVVQINMQLAEIGPEIRFMTKIAILHRGTEVVFEAWNKKTVAVVAAQVAQLNATVKFEDRHMSITFCDNHVVSFTPKRIITVANEEIDYLDFSVSVPGCHDSYGGALGHTYQCAYVQHKKQFEWSTEREESFRLKSLITSSGTYSKDAECAREDEFGSKELLGGMSF